MNLEAWPKKVFFPVLIALFALLTLLYFRLSFAGGIMTRHLGTDLYLYWMHAKEQLHWLGQGFIPLGDYWVPHGGGFPATPFDQFLVPSNLLTIFFYGLTHNPTLSLKLVTIAIYFATLLMAFWYGKVLFKRRDVSIVLAVIYTFGMYGVGQLEHIDLMSAQPIILLVLIFLEKTFQTRKASHIVFASVFLFIMYLTHLYPFYFLVIFIVLRTLYEWKWSAAWDVAKICTLAAILALPFFIPQSLNTPSQAVKDDLNKGLGLYAQPPGLYFVRSLPNYFTADARTMYLGVSAVLLALAPIVLSRTKGSRPIPRMYYFYLIVMVGFLLYSVGKFSSVNLAQVVHDYLPGSYFIRVPGRALVIGLICLAVCTAIGTTYVLGALKPRLRIIALAIIVAVVFCDLALGYEPPTMTMALNSNEAYSFIRNQPGDFKIMELPSVATQMATDNVYTGHDTISNTRWAYNYFLPLYEPTNLYRRYLDTPTDARDLAVETAFYGVKYVLVNLDPAYYENLKQPLIDIGGPDFTVVEDANKRLLNSPDFKVVYAKDDYIVYEDLLYRGMVFTIDAPVTDPHIFAEAMKSVTVPQSDLPTNLTFPTPLTAIPYNFSSDNPNTFSFDTNFSITTRVVIDQSFAEGWHTNVGEIKEANGLQIIDVPPGPQHVVLKYQRYPAFYVGLLAFWLAFLVLAIPFRRKGLVVSLYGVALLPQAYVLHQLWPAAPSPYSAALAALGLGMIAVGLGWSVWERIAGRVRRVERVRPEVGDEEVKRYYREEAEQYDWIADAKYPEKLFHVLRARHLLSLIRRYASHSSYLDVGCGTGLITRRLEGDVVGVDIHPWAIKRAALYCPSATLLIADAEALPFEDERFDCVICSDVLEHLPRAELALHEMVRVLKTDGVVIGEVPSTSPIWKFRSNAVEPFHRNYETKEVKQMLKERGLKVVWMKTSVWGMEISFVARKERNEVTQSK